MTERWDEYEIVRERDFTHAVVYGDMDVLVNGSGNKAVKAMQIGQLSNGSGRLDVIGETVRSITNTSGYLNVLAEIIGPITNASGYINVSAKTITDLHNHSGQGLTAHVSSVNVVQNDSGNVFVVGRHAEGIEEKIDVVRGDSGNVYVCGLNVGEVTVASGNVFIVNGSVMKTVKVESGSLSVYDGEVLDPNPAVGSGKIHIEQPADRTP